MTRPLSERTQNIAASLTVAIDTLAKQMIAEGRHHQLTIAALSEQCGFKRSSFFSTFRKMEGITPYEFIKKNGKN